MHSAKGTMPASPSLKRSANVAFHQSQVNKPSSVLAKRRKLEEVILTKVSSPQQRIPSPHLQRAAAEPLLTMKSNRRWQAQSSLPGGQADLSLVVRNEAVSAVALRSPSMNPRLNSMPSVHRNGAPSLRSPTLQGRSHRGRSSYGASRGRPLPGKLLERNRNSGNYNNISTFRNHHQHGSRGPSSRGGGSLLTTTTRGMPSGSIYGGLLSTIPLTKDQQLGLDLAIKGNSLFFTGSAGTGKSFLLRKMVTQLKEMHGAERVAVTAMTGVAACNIGGCTLHSFAGVGLASVSKDALVHRVGSNKRSLERWQQIKVLVIDEVSMLDSVFFEKLEYIGRKIRRLELPFGGIQLILSGDFLQLPPIQENNGDGAKKFCFESPVWEDVIKTTIILRQVFRQSDTTFVRMLNDIRIGNVTEEWQHQLKACMSPFHERSGYDPQAEQGIAIQPTRLYPHRKDVETENEEHLKALPGEIRTFEASDTGIEPFLGQLQRNAPAPQKLALKLRAQVMLTKNLDFELELVNGSRGIVVGFAKVTDKEQVSPHVDYPEVLFTNGVKRVLTPETWSIEVGGETTASRSQVPLSLAWALSVHKAQGMSISKVEMRLGSIWEYGQGYVALSRATSLEGLHIVDLNVQAIRANPKVLAFYTDMERHQMQSASALQKDHKGQ